MASPEKDKKAGKKAGSKAGEKKAEKKEKAGSKRVVRTPAVVVNERFETKDGLVKEIEKLTAKKDLLAERLGKGGLIRVSNAKLLRLHGLITDVSAKFGSRAALVDSYLETVGRSKDQPYREKLLKYTLGRIWDMHQAAKRRAARAGRKAAAAK